MSEKKWRKIATCNTHLESAPGRAPSHPLRCGRRPLWGRAPLPSSSAGGLVVSSGEASDRRGGGRRCPGRCLLCLPFVFFQKKKKFVENNFFKVVTTNIQVYSHRPETATTANTNIKSSKNFRFISILRKKIAIIAESKSILRL